MDSSRDRVRKKNPSGPQAASELAGQRPTMRVPAERAFLAAGEMISKEEGEIIATHKYPSQVDSLVLKRLFELLVQWTELAAPPSRLGQGGC